MEPRAVRPAAPFVAAALLLAGCASPPPLPPDDAGAGSIPSGSPTDGRPPFRAPPATVSKLELVATGASPADGCGTLLRVLAWDNVAYVTNHGCGGDAHSVLRWDVSSPLAPRSLSSVSSGNERPVLPDPVGGIDGSTFQGLDVLHYGNRTVLAAPIWTAEGSFQGEQGPIVFWDVTDPEDTRELTRVRIYSATVAANRPAHLVYSSNHGPANRGALDIVDATDPDAIRLASTWSWPSRAEDGTELAPSWCSHLHLDHARSRLYCTAAEQTIVLDVSTPAEPRAVTAVSHPEMPAPASAFTLLDGRVLAVVDAGVPGPVARAAQSAEGRLQQVWFFDLDTSPPAYLGRVGHEATDFFPSLGTEIGEGTGILAIPWGDAGLVLVDASDPASPRIVESDVRGDIVRGAFYYRGLVFGAAQEEGLLVAAPMGAS